MVWAREVVDHLEVKELLLEVGWIPECNEELGASKRDGLDLGNDPEEGSSSRVEVLLWDSHSIQRVGIEDIEAAPLVHQHLH